MAPMLETLPPELFEDIVEYLAPSEIGNLRLTGRNVMLRATQRRFRGYFVEKRVRLTKPCLESFVAVTKPGSLGLLLEKCILFRGLRDFKGLETAFMSWKAPSTIHHGPKFNLAARTADIANERELGDLLGKAFDQLKLHSHNPQLLEVILEDLDPDLTDYEIDDWIEDSTFPPENYERRVSVARFEVAIRSIRTLASALHQSGIAVKRLSLFEKHDNTQPSYVPLNHLAAMLESDVVTSIIRNLQELSITLANSTTKNPLTGVCVWTGDPNEERYYAASARQKTRIRAGLGIDKLLKLTPDLRKLRLRWYGAIWLSTDTCNTFALDQLKRERYFFTAAVPYLPRNLSTCALDNIKTTGSALLSFVQATPLIEFTLREMHLEEGTFRETFDYVTRSDSTLELLRLEDLWEAKLLFFPKEPKEEVVYARHTIRWPTFVLRRGKEVKRPLEYAFKTSRSKGSAAAMMWMRHKQAKYGYPM